MASGRLDWQYRGEYVSTRSQRRPGDADIEPAWAEKAFEDQGALVDSPDPASKSGKPIGWSATPRRPGW